MCFRFISKVFHDEIFSYIVKDHDNQLLITPLINIINDNVERFFIQVHALKTQLDKQKIF